MSLQSLAELRRNRFKPGIVFVVVGKTPDVDDAPYIVTVLPGDNPERMDWRPIVGLPVALMTADGHEILGERTVDALHELKAHLVGSAWREQAFALDDAAKPALRRAWELLCQ